MSEAVLRFDEDESVKQMFTQGVAGLSSQLSSMTMNDDYKKYVFVSQV
jgi:ubiquitin conjugation factor E4 B